MALIPSFLRTRTTALFFVLVTGASGLEASGNAAFEPAIEFDDGDRTYEMMLTGHTKRTFFFLRVYDIAHYAEPTADSPDMSPATVVLDGPGKAIAITFARTLSMERIREELRSSIQRNAKPGWLEQAQSTLDRFLEAIDRNAQDGDKLIYYWLPGGRIHAEFNGERFFTAEDVMFAKLVWSIWFGDDPACDRDALLALAPTDDS